MAQKRGTYSRIVDDFKLKINNFELAEEAVLPSEKEFMQLYAVSRTSVRKALAQLEQERLIYRRPGVGAFVRKRNQDSGLTGKLNIYIDLPICIPGLSFYNVLFTAAQKAAADNGNCRLLSLGNREFELDDDASGLIVTHAHPNDYPKLEKIAKKIPVVVFNRVNAPASLHLAAVDYRACSFSLIDRLIRNGCKRIMVVGDSTNPGNYTSFERGGGYRSAYSKHQMQVDSNSVISLEDGYNLENIVDKIRRSRPELIYITSEDFIADTLMALELTRKDLEHTPCIFSFDDVSNDSRLERYEISCFQMPLERMCSFAFEQFINNFNIETISSKRKIFTPRTIIGHCPFLI